MKLVLVLSIGCLQVLLGDMFQIVKVVGTLGVYTFVDAKRLPVLNWAENMSAMRASKCNGLTEAVIQRRKGCSTNLAKQLSFSTVILIKILGRSSATRTFTVIRDITGTATFNWFNLVAVALQVLILEPFKGPAVKPVLDNGKFVCFKLLVLR